MQSKDTPICIVGNGPSSTCEEASSLAENAEIIRMNWFFLEKEMVFGNKVDYFMSVSYENSFLHFLLYYLMQNEIYEVKNILFYKWFSDVLNNFERGEFNTKIKVWKNTKIKAWKNTKILGNAYFKLFEYAKILPLPEFNILNENFTGIRQTSGLNALGFALYKGYKDIRIVGVDFYTGYYLYPAQRNSQLKFWDVERFRDTEVSKNNNIMLPEIKTKIKTNLSDNSLHTIKQEMDFLDILFKEFSNFKLTVLVNNEDAEKIWSQYPNVKIIKAQTQEKKEPYYPYNDKKWLREASKQYAFQFGLKHLRQFRIIYIKYVIRIILKILPPKIKQILKTILKEKK